MKYVKIATNIGDVQTLVIHPASMIYVCSFGEQRKNAGACEDLIRIIMGLKDIDDPREDFAQAINNMNGEDL